MKSVVIALLFALVLGFATAAKKQGDLYTIDDFSINSDTLVVVITTTSTFPLTQTSFTQSGSIFSGERDLLLEVDSGPSGMVYSSSVDTGDWTSSAPSQGKGFAMLQYDGVDGSIVLDPTGAQSDSNSDFTQNGAFALHLSLSSDQATTVEIFVYSGSSSDFCSHSFNVPGTQTFADYIVNYSNFDKTGNGCDFTNVGAIEVNSNLPANVDISVQFFATYGNLATTGTPTPSRRPAASASRTPTRHPSKNPTHQPSQQPSHKPTTHPTHKPCNCVCPAFHCVLEYDPSGVNTVYFQTSALNGASGNNSSDASSLTACFALLAALIVLLI